MKTRKTRLINLQFFVPPAYITFLFFYSCGKMGGRRLKVSQYILHTCLASKNIFVQEGKNRTLMQSGNHVAVRNVIIQFFGRPLLYVFKLVTKKASSKNAKNSAKWLPKPLLPMSHLLPRDEFLSTNTNVN